MAPPVAQGGRARAFRKRGGWRGTVFSRALTYSFVLHLSAVTVFNIVIYLPYEPMPWYQVRFVPTAAPASDFGDGEPHGPFGERLALGGGQDDLLGAGDDAVETEDAPWLRPSPALDLPTLEFAELRRLRVRQAGAEAMALYDRVFDEPAPLAAEGLGAGLRRLTRNLRDSLGSGAAAAPETVAIRLASGFSAHIDWDGEPSRRRLLFAPPVRALSEADPGLITRAIDVVITVNAEGRVVNAWSPSLEAGPLLEGVQRSVLSWRFEPLVDGPAQQMGTLRMAPGEDAR